MEGDEGLNTVECLRGRLLAERQASRLAKEEAESMDNKVLLFWIYSVSSSFGISVLQFRLLVSREGKLHWYSGFLRLFVWQTLSHNSNEKSSWLRGGGQLVELEKKLRDETKLREKAEKKLQRLKKKLESLNISSSSEGSEQSCSSEKCESSCRSPASASSSASSDSLNPIMSENAKHNAAEPPPPITKDYDSRDIHNSTGDSNSGYTYPQNLLENPNPNPNSQDLKNDESRYLLWTCRVIAFDETFL